MFTATFDKKPKTEAQIKKIQESEWKKAAKDINAFVARKAKQYPPKPPGSAYRRTYTLRKSIRVVTVQKGTGVDINLTSDAPYAKAVDTGVGIYGPSGRVIRPKGSSPLAWQSSSRGSRQRVQGVSFASGRARRSPKLSAFEGYARYVRGYKGWKYIENSINSVETQAYVNQRLKQMIDNIARRVST